MGRAASRKTATSVTDWETGIGRDPCPFLSRTWEVARSYHFLRNEKAMREKAGQLDWSEPAQFPHTQSWGQEEQNNSVSVPKEPKGSKELWTLPLGRQKGPLILSCAQMGCRRS